MSRIAAAKRRMLAREREIRRKFKGVQFCPDCGCVLVYIQDVSGCMQRPGYFCRNCKKEVKF